MNLYLVIGLSCLILLLLLVGIGICNSLFFDNFFAAMFILGFASIVFLTAAFDEYGNKDYLVEMGYNARLVDGECFYIVEENNIKSCNGLVRDLRDLDRKIARNKKLQEAFAE